MPGLALGVTHIHAHVYARSRLTELTLQIKFKKTIFQYVDLERKEN